MTLEEQVLEDIPVKTVFKWSTDALYQTFAVHKFLYSWDSGSTPKIFSKDGVVIGRLNSIIEKIDEKGNITRTLIFNKFI